MDKCSKQRLEAQAELKMAPNNLTCSKEMLCMNETETGIPRTLPELIIAILNIIDQVSN